MNFNKEIFEQTLKIAELSTVDFEKPIVYDDTLIGFGEKYLNVLLNEPMIIQHCCGIADDYYYMIASHALYAAFCIANGENEKDSKEKILEAVMGVDSVLIFQMSYRNVDTDNIDWYTSTVYDMAINSMKVKYGQKCIIDNNNEYILGILMAFFVIGYHLRPEYFEDE